MTNHGLLKRRFFSGAAVGDFNILTEAIYYQKSKSGNRGRRGKPEKDETLNYSKPPLSDLES